MPGADKDPSYVSASISLIVHPRSPRVPTVHMNTRFLSTAESWFGGGADLTPMLTEQRSQEADDAVLFHRTLQGACDAYDPEAYQRYKAWCDEYFYLPHRKETRGVGGIFYDRLNSGDFEARLRLHPRRRRGTSSTSILRSSATGWTSPGPRTTAANRR